MKGTLKLLAALSIILFTVSCSDDEPKPAPHEVGDWELDSFFITDLPSDYQLNDGRTFGVSEILFGGIQFESYTITINANGSFSRKIGLINSPNLNDDGSWEIDDDDFELVTEDGDELFGIEKNESDQLWLSTPATFGLVKDDILDTLSQAWVNSLTDEEYNALFDPVSLDLVYAFERD
ncbi:MAG: hypothetical protein ABJG41_08445 [Cyclobacteriaceae bacterium]